MAAFTPNVDLTLIKRLFGAVEQPGGFVVSDVIAPVIEIQDLSLMTRREFIPLNSSFAVVGGVISDQVSDGEFWQVHMILTETDVLDADQAIVFQLMIRPPGQLGSIRPRFGATVSVAASSEGGIGQIFVPPLFLPAGTTIGAAVNEITVGAAGLIAIHESLQITRIQI